MIKLIKSMRYIISGIIIFLLPVISLGQDIIYMTGPDIDIHNANKKIIQFDLATGIQGEIFSIKPSEYGISKGILGLVSDPWNSRAFFHDYNSVWRIVNFNTGEVKELFDFKTFFSPIYSSIPYVSPNGKYVIISTSGINNSKKFSLYCLDGDDFKIISKYDDWGIGDEFANKVIFKPSNTTLYVIKPRYCEHCDFPQYSIIFVFRIPDLNLLDTLRTYDFQTDIPLGYNHSCFQDIKNERVLILSKNVTDNSLVFKLIDIETHKEFSPYLDLPEITGVGSLLDYKVFLSSDAEFLYVYYNEVLYQHNATTGKLISRLETPGMGKLNYPKYLFQDDRLYHIGTNINRIDWRNNTIISSVPVQDIEK